MEDGADAEWVVVVPSSAPTIADSLWREWSALHGSMLASEDVRIDLIRAVGGEVRRYLVRGIARPLAMRDLAEELGASCSTASELIATHLGDYDGEILGHLLIADVRRHLESEFGALDPSETCGCLDALARGIAAGDASVQNGIGVSFVEDSQWWEPDTERFMRTWPRALKDEVDRQRAASKRD